MPRIAAAAAALAALLPIAAAPPAAAAANGSWEVLPAGTGRVFLVYSLQPGQVVHDAITIRNLTRGTLSLHLYSTRAVNTPRNGAFGLLAASALRSGVAAWVQLAGSDLTLPPDTRITVPFTLTVPPGAAPGDQTGGIVAAESTPAGRITTGSAHIAVVHAVGVRLYARVAGPLQPGLNVESLRVRRTAALLRPLTGTDRAAISYVVANTGNVREAAVANIRVTDELGRTVARLPDTQLPDLLPGGTVPVSATWTGLPLLGRFTVHVAVRAGAVTAARSAATWNVDWGDGVVALVVVGGGVWLGVRHRRRRLRLSPRKPATSTSATAVELRR